MNILKAALPVFIAAAISGSAMAQGTSPSCAGAQHRAFDFWLGDWKVHTPDGKLAGTNSIKREHANCVLHERYDNGRGYTGESLNMYDSARNVWHQTWVDSSGLLLLLEGGVREGRMELVGQTIGAGGAVTKHRITWTLNPDGSVRQFWESTDKDGKWAVAFDGLYTRQ